MNTRLYSLFKPSSSLSFIAALSICFFHNSALLASEVNFEQCKSSLFDKALAAGVSEKVATQIIPQLKQKKRVIKLDKNQPEFVKTFPNYFSKRVNQWRIDKGRELAIKHKDFLRQLTHTYGVPAPYLLAFWGLETNYGGYKGKIPVLDALATLACDQRRKAFFTQELITALRLVERESLDPNKMLGSWAGAMGHTQFMPSNYEAYAIDGDGNGQINLWDSEQDALASAANFLSQLGWQPGYRWGREIKLPEGFSYENLGYDNRKPLSEWRDMGILKTNNKELGEADISAYALAPAGYQGPAFLVYKNFRIIMRWNNSEFYAISVGHLADRIAGMGTLSKELPVLPEYTTAHIKQLQHKLNELGYKVGKPDGIMGPATRSGIRAFQKSKNLIADGFPSQKTMIAADINV